MLDRNITGNVILVGKVCDMRLSSCRPSEDVGWLVLSGWGEGGEGRGGECQADLDFTWSRPCQGSARVIIHHHHHHHQSCFYNTTSLVTFNRNFLPTARYLPLNFWWCNNCRDPVTTGPRDSLDSIVGTWARAEVNLIKYQPGLRFLCDTDAY